MDKATERLSEGLATEQDGDYERGSRAEQRAVGNQIISNAKKHSLFVEPSQARQYGERKKKRSGESVVYTNEEEIKVYKVKDPYAKLPIKRHGAADVLYEHEAHNLLFPDAPYTFIGVTEGIDGPRIILSQEFIEGAKRATQKEIEDYLAEKLHLDKEDEYTYGNNYYAITDVSINSDNVIKGKDGQIYFIDPLIKFKKPGKEVIEHLWNNQPSSSW